MDLRSNVQAVIDGILSGDILGTFERWYADDVVMAEGGAERVGKAANREYEQAFVDGVTFHSATLGAVLVDGDAAAVEWSFDLTPHDGERVTQRQVSIQRWRDGQVVREDFYLG